MGRHLLAKTGGDCWPSLDKITTISDLTEVAGEGGPDLAPQKFLLSQKFRHLMRCKKYLAKIFLSCLVSEIQLFVYIFGQNSKCPPEVSKGPPVKFFEVSYYLSSL